MMLKKTLLIPRLAVACGLFLLTACRGNPNSLQIKLLVGSALGDFCHQAAQNFNATQPQLDNGKAFQVGCEAKGSGDVVTKVVSLATQLKNGTLQADAADFPTIISLDGDIYHSQLIYRMNQLFPGQNYIPEVTESPLVANTPMVWMAQVDVAGELRQAAKKHGVIQPVLPLAVQYVHTVPTRSNSGLQTLVAQYANISGKRPEELTVADVQKLQPQMQQIHNQIIGYGISTNSLAQAIIKNDQFKNFVGLVYESSVIAVNSALPPDKPRYQAVYPRATFTSNMRTILPNAPWVSADEKAAAAKFINYWRSPATQKLATDLGLRPGTPGVALGAKFTPEFGVDSQAKYDSLRSPQPEVVEIILEAWQEAVKK
ncbi:MAG: ABC transporter substrate-binding protein [Trichormus sp. ATA11-4-KO1]|jgi:Ca-activated chloride channel family protein|nr:ABC transporter substrate-binding protein [Trichormus sp. ATA11-4-KO1]